MGFSKIINPLITKFPGVYIPPIFKQPLPQPQDKVSENSYESSSDPWEDADPLIFYTTSKSVGFITNYMIKLAEIVMLCSKVTQNKPPRPKRARKSKPV